MAPHSIESAVGQSNRMLQAVMGSTLSERPVQALGPHDTLLLTFLDRTDTPQQAVISVDEAGLIKVFSTAQLPEMVAKIQGRPPAEVSWENWVQELTGKAFQVSYVDD